MSEPIGRPGLEYGYSQDWTDWDNYSKYRPIYPDSTVKLIMEYHRAHSNSLRLAHDIGSGSGIFVPRLAEYFQHVHVSDPNSKNIAQARDNLGKWYAENWHKAKFSFSVTPAEQACDCVVKGSVDMATLMMSAHWTDVEVMVRSVGESLAPNGTLAIVQYNPACVVVDNEAVNAAVDDLFRTWGEEGIMSAGEDSVAARRGMPQSNSGLDYVPLPEGVFIQDVTKRIKINLRETGDKAFVIPGQETRIAPSKVDPQHRTYAYQCREDKEAEGWQQVVDAAWFRGFIASLEQEGKLHLFEERFRAIEQATEETSQSGTVTIEWTVAILLATRK